MRLLLYISHVLLRFETTADEMRLRSKTDITFALLTRCRPLWLLPELEADPSTSDTYNRLAVFNINPYSIPFNLHFWKRWTCEIAVPVAVNSIPFGSLFLRTCHFALSQNYFGSVTYWSQSISGRYHHHHHHHNRRRRRHHHYSLIMHHVVQSH